MKLNTRLNLFIGFKPAQVVTECGCYAGFVYVDAVDNRPLIPFMGIELKSTN